MRSVAFLGLVPFFVGFVYIVVPYVYIKWLRHRQARRMKAGSSIALTFDDGPGARLTPAILDLLDEYNARATFFMLGRNVKGQEDLVRAVADRGHEIGTHSYDHLHGWRVWPTRAIADIQRGQNEIKRILNTKRVLAFRPPCGKVNLLTLGYLLVKRIPICMWTLDTRDTWGTNDRDITQIEEAIRLSGSGISLAHDFDRTESSLDEYILSTIRSILDYAKNAGIQLVTMTEALGGAQPQLSTPAPSQQRLPDGITAPA